MNYAFLLTAILVILPYHVSLITMAYCVEDIKTTPVAQVRLKPDVLSLSPRPKGLGYWKRSTPAYRQAS